MNGQWRWHLMGSRLVQACLLVWATCALAQAAPQDVLHRFEAFGVRDGLSHGTVTSIVEDTVGFLWVGTVDGLNRFDGRRFVRYFPSQDNPAQPGLANARISWLMVDRQGVLWVTNRSGVSRYIHKEDRFVKVPLGAQEPFEALRAERVVEDLEGSIWVTTDNGLFRYDKDKDRFQPLAGSDPWLRLPMRAISASPDGFLYIHVLGKGLLVLNLSGFATEHLPATKDGCSGCELLAAGFKDILADKPGQVLLGSKRGLLRLDVGTKQMVQIPLFADKRVQPDARRLMRGDDDELWVATTVNGVFRLQGQKVAHFMPSPLFPQMLGNKQIFALGKSSDGSYWFGSYAGLFRLSSTASQIPFWQLSSNKDLADKARWVSCLSVDAEGQMWAGQLNQGLWKLGRSPGDESRLLKTPHPLPYTMESAPQGGLWIGFDGGGLYHFDTKTLAFKAYGPDRGVTAPWITVVRVDRDGRTWVGTNDGLFVYHKDADRFEFIDMGDLGESGTQPFILDIEEDASGILWLGSTIYGVIRFDPVTRSYLSITNDPNNRNSLPHTFVYDVLAADNDVLYLATRGGLSRFDVKAYKFTNLRREQGLPNNTVFGLAWIDDHLWAATEDGLVYTSAKLENVKTLIPQQGLFAAPKAYGAFLHHGHQLLLGHNGGIQVVPDYIFRPQQPKPPVPVVEGIYHQGRNLLKSYHTPLTYPHAELIEIPYTLRRFNVRIAAPNLSTRNEVEIQYRLRGLDEHWRRVRKNFEDTHYANLPPGRYTLQVRTGMENVWGPVYTPALVLVEPAPWWNPVAWTMYAMVLSGFWWWVRRKQQHRVQELEAVSRRLQAADKAKDELLSNVSHELKTPLNGIVGLAELLKDGLLGELPKEARQACEDILNAGHRLNLLVSNLLSLSQIRAGDLTVHFQEVNVLEVLRRIERILRRELPFKRHIRMRFRVPEDLDIKTDSLMFEQIMTNLLHNALKFSEDGTVDVAIERVDDHWLVSVTDSGIGMDETTQKSITAPFQQADSSLTRKYGGLGLGLTICKSLLHELGARLWVSSEPGVGTSISFYLPVDPEAAD